MSEAIEPTHSLTERELKMSSSVAMVMTLVSFSMLFATLFLGYFLHRLTIEVWPPAGIQRVPYFLPTISTLFILLSSVFFWRFERAFEFEKKCSWFDFVATLITGIAFVVSQFFLWQKLETIGIYVDTTIFGSILYGFTWIHAAHVALGFLGLFLLFIKLRKVTFNTSDTLWVQNIGKFWHFLSIVWLLMFFSIFIF